MYKKVVIIGIDAEQDRSNLHLADRLSQYGNNTGNLVFSEALYRSIAFSSRSSYHFQERDVEGCDAIVVAAANWLNPYSNFSDLANRLERLSLPVIIVGVGAQANIGSLDIPKLTDGTLKLMKLCSERSTTLSARGDFTCEVLASYGIKNAISTGCPSLLLSGSHAPVLRRSTNIVSAELCLHSTRHLLNKCSPFQAYLYQQAIKLDVDLVMQSELADMYVITDGAVDAKVANDINVILKSCYNKDFQDVQSYLKRHGKIFWDLENWMTYMRRMSFCVGTRIHGTIIGLLSGTPATLIAHDSRTLEMARIMNIPHVTSSDIPLEKDLEVNSLYNNEAFDAFEAGYASYRKRFLDFFESNNLGIRTM